MKTQNDHSIQYIYIGDRNEAIDEAMKSNFQKVSYRIMKIKRMI
jgi:hypothetical protein